MNDKHRILMVDDEQNTDDLLNDCFIRAGLMLDHVPDRLSALRYIERHLPDLVILDAEMTDDSSEGMIDAIKSGADVPVIVLAAGNRYLDHVKCFKAGASDVVLRPFQPEQLTERVCVHLKPQDSFVRTPLDPVAKFDQLTIDYKKQMVYIGVKKVPLTHTEFQIMSILTREPERYHSSETIYEKLWMESAMGDTRGVLVHISNLRKKLHSIEPSKVFILTKRNHGYKFNEHLGD